MPRIRQRTTPSKSTFVGNLRASLTEVETIGMAIVGYRKRFRKRRKPRITSCSVADALPAPTYCDSICLLARADLVIWRPLRHATDFDDLHLKRELRRAMILQIHARR
jgi:hypothetical protein